MRASQRLPRLAEDVDSPEGSASRSGRKAETLRPGRAQGGVRDAWSALAAPLGAAASPPGLRVRVRPRRSASSGRGRGGTPRLLLLLPARASAEEPFRMASQIEDRAGVLGDRTGRGRRRPSRRCRTPNACSSGSPTSTRSRVSARRSGPTRPRPRATSACATCSSPWPRGTAPTPTRWTRTSR